jgi:hypothetical protein
VPGYTQLKMNSDFTKFIIADKNNPWITLYRQDTGTVNWYSKNPISTSPAVRSFSLSSDWTILAYIDKNNEVYISKYDSVNTIYTNPTKVTLF